MTKFVYRTRSKRQKINHNSFSFVRFGLKNIKLMSVDFVPNKNIDMIDIPQPSSVYQYDKLQIFTCYDTKIPNTYLSFK